MELTYRTLQRPEDVVFCGPANLVTKRESDGTMRKVIRHQRGKTETKVDILVTAEIDNVLQSLMPKNGEALAPGSTFLRNRLDKPYTYSGISSMLRRYIKAVGIKESLGFYDLKGKGATDIWRDGVPLEVSQVLRAHESKTSIEIYVKARWIETVTPNRTNLAG